MRRTQGDWIIWEKSGRWAAALRTATAHLSAERLKASVPRRIREVRSLDEFQSALDDGRFQLGLVEVRLENLAAILGLLSSRSRSRGPIAALLDETLRGTANQLSVDVLREAGALTVVNSPRRISALLALTQGLAATPSSVSAAADEQPSFADWARSALPWQDA
jgi:hypothetical protein